jgi:pimeloyl-ACP methyl ester carboxylesterase
MSAFKKGVLECNGLTIRYAESGEGRPVVLFPAGGGELFSDVVTELAAQHRVIVLDVPVFGLEKVRDFAESLSQSLTRLDVVSFSVIGVAQGATLALGQAVYTPGQIHRLILLSPPLASVQSPDLGARLREVKAPTLVLVGTRDRSGSRDAGRRCREQIPACHLLLVYDAGHAITTDRREACLSPIGEFLEQGEGFIVSHDSQLIRP